jgi:hypothetical protein
LSADRADYRFLFGIDMTEVQWSRSRSSFILSEIKTKSGLRLTNFRETLNKVGVFGRGVWRYWRLGEPAPESNYIVQKLYAYIDSFNQSLGVAARKQVRAMQNHSREKDGAGSVQKPIAKSYEVMKEC